MLYYCWTFFLKRQFTCTGQWVYFQWNYAHVDRLCLSMNQDKDVVKIGKKEFVQTTKLNWKAGDNEPVIHMDFARPKLKGYGVKAGTSGPSYGKPCKKYHSNRLTYDPKTRKFVCSLCGRKPKK